MQYQLLPDLTESEYESLKAHIAEHGVLVPVEYDEDGNILDGHHRLRACVELGITDWPSIIRPGLTEDEKRDHVLALNLERRHLTQTQKRDVIAKLLAAKPEASDRSVAEQVGATHPTVASVRDGLEKGGKINHLDTRTGADGKTYPATRPAVVTTNAKDRDKALDVLQSAPDAGDGTMTSMQLRQAAARQHKPEPAITPPLPAGKYRCIVMDPPWPMQKIERETVPDQGVELDYPVMSLEDIAALDVPGLSDDAGCHLYLWTTHKFLPDALALVAGWGFRYQCLLTWTKPSGFTPFSWMYNTEHVVFARLGSLQLLQVGLKLGMEAPTTRHSAKPDVFYERVVAASPGPRLEMFARGERDGFDVWGNEAE